MAGIVETDNVLGGEPRIENTRVGVLDVYELVVGSGYSPADVADQLDCSLAEIYTALAYYHDNTEKMRALRRERAALEADLEATALQPPEPAQ